MFACSESQWEVDKEDYDNVDPSERNTPLGSGDPSFAEHFHSSGRDDSHAKQFILIKIY